MFELNELQSIATRRVRLQAAISLLDKVPWGTAENREIGRFLVFAKDLAADLEEMEKEYIQAIGRIPV